LPQLANAAANAIAKMALLLRMNFGVGETGGWNDRTTGATTTPIVVPLQVSPGSSQYHPRAFIFDERSTR
jgi:hypothetical protein